MLSSGGAHLLKRRLIIIAVQEHGGLQSPLGTPAYAGYCQYVTARGGVVRVDWMKTGTASGGCAVAWRFGGGEEALRLASASHSAWPSSSWLRDVLDGSNWNALHGLVRVFDGGIYLPRSPARLAITWRRSF
eukprot:TRINITY_DN14591_c0_g2_i1.p2 TRINITY_DN14591_c0_g2~~TRINITY_DN14591_c0_g2_i1.p2  ORF type:complete len:132 (-),score=6.59 TRINITY_DN14591_c0_g2_i1:56-451(-)